jgi:hypothetical protein
LAVAWEDSFKRTQGDLSMQGWKRALPYLGTLLLFALIFWRVPAGKVVAALEQAPVLKFAGIFLPFSVFYWMLDSACLTWVIRRFNAPLRFREILPIRASMYLLALVNTNVAQGGVAWYVHRKSKANFLEVLSSILLIGLMEVYQLFLFSTLGVIFYRPAGAAQHEVVRLLRLAYMVGWAVLIALIATFAYAQRNARLRDWIAGGRLGGVAATFLAARPLDYAIVLGIKAPTFFGALVAHRLALSLYGITIPFFKLVLFLPLVFLAAALPITVAHLGTSQAAWMIFFAGNAPEPRILAYSLAAHFTFMFCNGLIGLAFLPRASRELTAAEAPAAGQLRADAPGVRGRS